MGGLAPIRPLPPRGDKDQKPWADVSPRDEAIVVTLSGWRLVFAMKRKVVLPYANIVAIEHDPDVYHHVQTRVRLTRRTGNKMFRIGAYHGFSGWSFWSCGIGRNAVVFETTGVQYRYVVVEMPDPQQLARNLRQEVGLTAKPPERKRQTARRTAAANRRFDLKAQPPPQSQDRQPSEGATGDE
jgi:hypothetical protein